VDARGCDNRRIRAHLYPEVAAHVMRATETAHWLEWRDWGNPIIAEPFEVKDGFIHVPDRPGNGIAWNEEAVRRYAY
jgi:mandelate racemase